MGQYKTSIHCERDTKHFNIKSFNRDHVIRFENGVMIHATSAPEFTGNPDLISPEDLFVATISSCHMMTFLAVASLNKWQVQTYKDHAQGFLEENPAGRIMMNRVILQPQVVFSGSNHPSRISWKTCTSRQGEAVLSPIPFALRSAFSQTFKLLVGLNSFQHFILQHIFKNNLKCPNS